MKGFNLIILCVVVLGCCLDQRQHEVQAQPTIKDELYTEVCHSECMGDIFERMAKEVESKVLTFKQQSEERMAIMEREIVLQKYIVKAVESKLQTFQQQSEEKVKELENRLDHHESTEYKSTDTRGKEFLISFMRMQWQESNPSNQINEIVISAYKDTDVTVQCKDPLYSHTFHIKAKTTIRIHDLPNAVRQQTSNIIQEKGVYVKANEEVSVQGLIGRSIEVIDGFNVLPIDESFTHFVIATYIPLSTHYRSGFVIAATDDYTEVKLYSPVSGGGVALKKTLVMHSSNTFAWYSSTSDYTGYQVTSNKPIAVYAGVDGTTIKSGFNMLYESMPPVSKLGEMFIAPSIAGRHSSAGYLLRVIAVYNETEISFFENSNQFTYTLNESQNYARNIGSASECTGVSCSKPCLVVQYNTGYNAETCTDCNKIQTEAFMVPITPIKSFQKEAQFANLQYRGNNVTSSFPNNSVVVITDNQTLPYLRFNGLVQSANWSKVHGWSNGSYWFKVFKMREGFNELDATHEHAGEGFAAYVQGYGGGSGGYGYRTGW